MARFPALVRKVEKWLADQAMGKGGLVVAVSGGPDSVALLRALLRVRGARAEQPFHMAHLNHQLRGPESEADAAFVRQLHANLAAQEPTLGWHTAEIDVARQAKMEKANLESVARQVRYDWLVEVAQANHCSWIATGHTADDQAETVIHRLLRGSGLQGLCGIAARRPLAPGLELIRPLLDIPRREVLAFLEEEHQPYCLDRTNLDMRFTRNRLRLELLPLLARQYNPAITSILCRLSQQVREAHSSEQDQGRTVLALAELPRAGNRVILDRQRFAGVPVRVVREALRLIWQRENWPTGRMTFASWERAATVAMGAAPSADFPGRIRIRCRKSVVQLGPAE